MYYTGTNSGRDYRSSDILRLHTVPCAEPDGQIVHKVALVHARILRTPFNAELDSLCTLSACREDS